MKIGLLLLIALSISSYSLFAQQDPLLSHYMFANSFINPAASGTHGYAELNASYRAQWLKMPGSPKTALFMYEKSFKEMKHGIGFIFDNDRLGVTSNTGATFNYNYKITVGTNTYLSMGLRAGLEYYSVNVNQLTYWDSGDKVYASGNTSSWIPKLGAGIYLYNNDAFFGVSAPALVGTELNNSLADANIQGGLVSKHYYMHTGVVISLSDDIKLKPTALLKFQKATDPNLDLSCTAYLYEVVGVGLTYRHHDALAILVEVFPNERIRIGYAYDLNIYQLRPLVGSTHELSVGYNFYKEEVLKIMGPRYF